MKALCQWLSIRLLWSQHIVWLLLRSITAVTWAGEKTRHPAAAMIWIYLSWIDNHEKVGKREREREGGRGGGKNHAKARVVRDEISKHTRQQNMIPPALRVCNSSQPASQPASHPASHPAWVKFNAATKSQFWPTICCMKGFFLVFFFPLIFFNYLKIP
jgi:hypothetical protein